MCTDPSHFLCDACFADFIITESDMEHCIKNSGTIPGCPFRECKVNVSPTPHFEDQTIALHVGRGVFKKYMDGQRKWIEKQTRDQIAQDELHGSMTRLRSAIAELLLLKCPNGHCFDYDGCDAIEACGICKHAFCAVCGYDAGIGGDAHDHCQRVHGDYYSRSKAIPTRAKTLEAKIIQILCNEKNENVRVAIVMEMYDRGEYDLWRPHLNLDRLKTVAKYGQENMPKTGAGTALELFSLHKILRPHTLPLCAAHFDTLGDRLITCSYDRTARIWNTHTGEEVCKFEGHKNVIFCVAFNKANNDIVATGSFDKTARLYNSQTGQLLHHLAGHKSEVVCMKFNQQGKLLATGSMDATAKVWDVDTGKCVCTLQKHTQEVVAMDFAPRGEQIVTGSFDSTVRLWNAKTGECIRTFEGHTKEVLSVHFSPCGSFVVSSSSDCTAKVWDAETGRCIATLRGHTDEVTNTDIHASGEKMFLATASSDSTCRLWNLKTAECIATCVGHTSELTTAVFNSQGTRVLTCSLDKTARVYDVGSGKCLQEMNGHEDELFMGEFNEAGDKILTASKDNSVRVWFQK